MDLHLRVEDEHFEYLRLQKGALDEESDDREVWHELYEISLAEQFDSIKPFLPAKCWGLLDIGSGLGGIDVLIGRHYAAQHRGPRSGWPFVHLLDGVDDKPEMILHRQTYNSMRVAKDFQVKNGMPSDRFCYYGTREQLYVKPFDLVMSFGSWCFHYEPAVYLSKLISGGGLHEDSVVIVDVRATKPEWIEQLDQALRREAVITTKPKWHRIVYGIRPRTR